MLYCDAARSMHHGSQNGDRDLRLTKLNACTNGWTQHPYGDHRDYARAIVHVDNAPGAALFAISIDVEAAKTDHAAI